uniref:Lamina-associated polypeptide 2 alpha C-terminal domain-containing protein n=1 Tax=Xenopus tropicalis TaxID=8364 RepID=A0A803J2E4_XENTR
MSRAHRGTGQGDKCSASALPQQEVRWATPPLETPYLPARARTPTHSLSSPCATALVGSCLPSAPRLAARLSRRRGQRDVTDARPYFAPLSRAIHSRHSHAPHNAVGLTGRSSIRGPPGGQGVWAPLSLSLSTPQHPAVLLQAISMTDGRGDLFSRGGRHPNHAVSFFACSKCLTKFREGQTEPLCSTCSPALPLPSDTTASGPGATSEGTPRAPSPTRATDPQGPSDIPGWAVTLSQSLASLQCIPQLTSSIDKMLTKLASSPNTSKKRKRIPSRPAPTTRDSLSIPSSDEEEASEGEIFSSSSTPNSDEEDNAVSAAPNIDNLIRAVLETLQIQEEEATKTKSASLFKRQHKTSAVFPAHDQMQALISEEWKTPDKKFQTSKHFNRQYPFPKEAVEKWSTPPVVDAPVSRLSKATALPVPDASAFKDPTDKKMEGLLKANFLSVGSALRPVLASAWVSRAVETWSTSLLQTAQEGGSREHMIQLAAYIQEANQFLADASLDAARVLARASALSVAARRALWLKLWSADLSSKKSLVAIPFQGSKLFGEELDKIISQATGGKSTLLPQTKPKSAFNPRRGHSFRSQGFRNNKTNQTTTHQSSFKGRFPNKGKSPWQSRKPQSKSPVDKTTHS